MKRFERTCFYVNRLDVVLAFASAVGLIYTGWCMAMPEQHCFVADYMPTELAVAALVGLNYVALVLANPRRWFVAVLLLPIRLFVVILGVALPIVALAGAAFAAQAGVEAAKAKGRARADALRQAAIMAAISAGSGSAGRTAYGVLSSRIRSLNTVQVR